MLKKWGPALLIAVAIVAMVVWAKCFETPIEHHEATKEWELRDIAVSIVREPTKSAQWTGEINRDLLSPLSAESRVAVDIGADLEEMRRVASDQLAANLRVHERSPVMEGSTSLIDSTQILMALIACETVLGDRKSAIIHARFANEISINALKSANSIEQWSQASAARMLFSESLAKIATDPGWTKVQRMFLGSFAHDLHRQSLARVIHLNLFDPIAIDVAEASERRDLQNVVAESIFQDPTEDETALVSALLVGHKRAFSPEKTMTSMSHSVKDFMASLSKPWGESEKVLDLLSESQSIWVEFEDILQKDDLSATATIKDLKAKIARTENPVGLALLHRQRLSWSNYVQSAYVADAKEAMAQIAIHKGTRDFDAATINDPLTGKPFDLTGKTPKTSLKDAGAVYSFVRAFAEID